MFAQCADNSTNGWDALILLAVLASILVTAALVTRR